MTEEALRELENFAVSVRALAWQLAIVLPSLKPEAQQIELNVGNLRLALADCIPTRWKTHNTWKMKCRTRLWKHK